MGTAMVRRTGSPRKTWRRLPDYPQQKEECSVGGIVVGVRLYFRVASSLMVSGMAGVELNRVGGVCCRVTSRAGARILDQGTGNNKQDEQNSQELNRN
ncbi:hypothetical protein GOODEAATRI_030215 [Goodea atripinnis]|uniref:Uncharacterized protein n=1 Tax=Goodea atripinnis TaxID=208336 RepID=A0ABV0MLZ9_9TELE